jgi:hypothetical protein
MSSNQKKRSSSLPTDNTPSKRSKTGFSSGGRPLKASSFVAVEDVALCKAYVNVASNPIQSMVLDRSHPHFGIAFTESVVFC